MHLAAAAVAPALRARLLRAGPAGGALLAGREGCGKSLLAAAAAAALAARAAAPCHVEWLEGRALARAAAGGGADGADGGVAAVEAALARAAARAPALVVLEDLDALAPAQDGAAREADGARGAARAALLADALRAARGAQRAHGGAAGGVAVLATARGAARVAAELLRAGALDARFEIPVPPPRTNRTRRVPHLVLIGLAASLTPY
jgi:SpoVK/Ycf46/Vps4 family AAA+-type ATPase